MKKCFLCGKKNPKVLNFKGTPFYNCYLKLLFRKEKGFKYNDIIFTKESIDKIGYHTQCYKKVTVLKHTYNEGYLSFVKKYREQNGYGCSTEDSYPEDNKEDLTHENENPLTGPDIFQENIDKSDVEDVKYFTTHVEIPNAFLESEIAKRSSISNYEQPSYDTLEVEKIPELDNSEDEKIPELDNSEDDLESFGKYVTSSLRTLSAKNCIDAQDEIQSILSKYKIRNLNNHQNSTFKSELCSSDSEEQS